VLGSRRGTSAIGLLLSVFLALSLWKVFGQTTSTLSIPSGPELTRSDPDEGQPARLVVDFELKEDNEGEDSPIGAADVCGSRDILAFAPTSVCQAWRAEVRSLVSQRVREGHGARGPPQA
jgi:hypothetical protein